MAGETLYFRREWLNEFGRGDAYISASIERWPAGVKADTKQHNITADVAIADCNRKIWLSFTVDDDEDPAAADNSFRKLETLLEVLQEFYDALAKAEEDWVRWKEEKDAA